MKIINCLRGCGWIRRGMTFDSSLHAAYTILLKKKSEYFDTREASSFKYQGLNSANIDYLMCNGFDCNRAKKILLYTWDLCFTWLTWWNITMEFIELNCVLKNMHITVTRTVLEVTKSAAAVEILVLPTFFFAFMVVCVCVFNQDRIN